MAQAPARKTEESSLGEELRRIRDLLGLSLREVEKITGVSNAYLSQLETGKIEKPAPSYLYKLSEAYNVPYELLMEKAGYIIRKSETDRKEHRSLAGAALATIDDITPEEAEALADYLAYLRSKKQR